MKLGVEIVEALRLAAGVLHSEAGDWLDDFDDSPPVSPARERRVHEAAESMRAALLHVLGEE